MSSLRFVADTLYELKINYGVPITLVRIKNPQVDFRTGAVTDTRTEYRIRKAICLDSNLMKAVLNSIITQDSRFSAAVDIDKKSLIVDRYDLPRDLTISLQDQFLLNGRLYSVNSIFSIDYRRGYLITLIGVLGDDLALGGSDSLTFSGGVVDGP